MFLIEYMEGAFIEGDSIEGITITKGRIVFWIHGNADRPFIVDKEFQTSFVNKLQAINSGDHVEDFYSRENKDDDLKCWLCCGSGRVVSPIGLDSTDTITCGCCNGTGLSHVIHVKAQGGLYHECKALQPHSGSLSESVSCMGREA